jgi:hypothetical protein
LVLASQIDNERIPAYIRRDRFGRPSTEHGPGAEQFVASMGVAFLTMQPLGLGVLARHFRDPSADVVFLCMTSLSMMQVSLAARVQKSFH